MTAAFEPKADLSEWRLLFEDWQARPLNPGDVLTYEILDHVLGRDFRANRKPLYRAVKELEATRQRTLAVQPNVGYRVLEAREHLDRSDSYRRRGRRSLQRAWNVLRATDRRALTPAERERTDRLELHTAAQWRVLAHHNARLDRVEGVLRRAGLLPEVG